MPALLTNISIRPKWAWTAAAILLLSSSLPASASTPKQSIPSCRSKDRVWSIFSLLRPVIATLAPCLPNTLAQDSPIPEVPPVTKTTLLCILIVDLYLKLKDKDLNLAPPNIISQHGWWITHAILIKFVILRPMSRKLKNQV